MSKHKRPPEGTLRQRVFALLRTASMSAPEMAKALGENHESVTHACLVMVRMRKVTRHRSAYTVAVATTTRWQAGRMVTVRQRAPVIFYSAKPNAKPPHDRRGKHPKSHVLTPALCFAGWLRMMQIRCGPTWRYKPRNAHPLDNWRPTQ